MHQLVESRDGSGFPSFLRPRPSTSLPAVECWTLDRGVCRSAGQTVRIHRSLRSVSVGHVYLVNTSPCCNCRQTRQRTPPPKCCHYTPASRIVSHVDRQLEPHIVVLARGEAPSHTSFPHALQASVFPSCSPIRQMNWLYVRANSRNCGSLPTSRVRGEHLRLAAAAT